MKNIFTLLISTLFALSLSAQTSLHGKVTASDTGEELIGAIIFAQKNDVFSVGTTTDFNGNFSMQLDPGTYDVNVSYIGFPDYLIQRVIVKLGQMNKLNIELTEPGTELHCLCCFIIYNPPLTQIDNTTSSSIIKSNEIQNSPFRDTKDLIINTVGVKPARY